LALRTLSCGRRALILERMPSPAHFVHRLYRGDGNQSLERER
jgi:hypothetical protein